MGRLKMDYEKHSVGIGSRWYENSLEVTVYSLFNGAVYFYDQLGWRGDLPEDIFKKRFKVIETKVDSFQIKPSDRKVGDLLNEELVIIIHTDGCYKGGNTTKVKYELADFMDDAPPFIEVCFINKDDDCVYFTEDLTEPVYESEGMLFVKGLKGEYHG